MSQFEFRQTEITSRLSKQGAMLDELRILLPLIRPEAARLDMRRAVVEENVLRRPSMASRTEVFKKLSTRYFRSDIPLTVSRFIQILQASTDANRLGLLAYVALLWNDALIFTLGTQWLAPKLSGPRLEVETHDIEIELDHLSKTFPTIRNWKPITRARIASHYLGVLRDVGYATGTVRKTLRRPFVDPEVVYFGAQLIVSGGEPTARVPEHPLFRAMGLEIGDVVDALSELRHTGQIDFAVQGGVVHLTLEKASAPA